jgi:uncharacterized protein (DUF1684 family)
MMTRTVLALAAVALFADATYVKEVEAWRAKHEVDYRHDYVSVSGLFFLKPGDNRAGSGPSNDIVLPRAGAASIGSFQLDGGRVTFTPRDGVKVLLNDGKPVESAIELHSDAGEPAVKADVLSSGTLAISVHMSGERPAIRTRDESGEEVRSFHGFTWFPIDEAYRVVGRFIKDPSPRDVIIPNMLGDNEPYKTEGVVAFTLQGRTLRIRPMTTRPNRFYFIFKDESSGHETYPAARFLYSDLRADGTTVLDFNEAYNPPCAFNPYTTCPLPPAENRLQARILAGEKIYIH